MASRRRARSRASVASAERQSIETTVDHAALSPPDDNELISQGELNGSDHDSGPVDSGEGLRGGLWPLPMSQMYALVLGAEIPIQRRPICDTYDPDAPSPGTPEPDSHTPERYAAWGQTHFGEEWYKQRDRMLQERNIYADHDLVYEQRQRDLRVLEHQIEGRPSRPGFRARELHDESWKSLWAHLSKNFPKFPTPQPDDSDDDNDNDNGSDPNLSGYSTFSPTPSPREPTPVPSDPFERLEYNRKHFKYNREAYQFARIFMLESLIDQRRKTREDELGDKQREKVREETEKIRYIPGTTELSREYRHLTRLYDNWGKGLAQEQIETNIREGEETVAQLMSYFGHPMPDDPEPKYNKEQLEERFRSRGNKKPRKTYVKERSSRRLAGMLPEFGLLPDQGGTTDPPLYTASPQQPSHARRSRRHALRKTVAVKDAEPHDIPATGRPRRGRPRRLAK
ncbi:hypothetical protein F5Y09DRAFT_352294 [Xylaria sp. FL1042]|nr:hypothetical protein F5Y09DRAFT_352294 [Xylaria sp. FL1042]